MEHCARIAYSINLQSGTASGCHHGTVEQNAALKLFSMRLVVIKQKPEDD
jgi:hypothetical protein